MGKKHDSQYANFGWLHIDKKLIIREKQYNQSLYLTLLAIHIYPLFFQREVRLLILLLSFSLF